MFAGSRFESQNPTHRMQRPSTAPEDWSLENAQHQARQALQTLIIDGVLDLTRAYDNEASAMTYVLPLIGAISDATGVELGGYIERVGQQLVVRQIFVGLPTTVPQLGGPRPHSAVAGFHTHPNGAPYFSVDDARWVHNPSLLAERRIPLYVIGGGEIRACMVGHPTCNPTGALGTPEGPGNRALRGVPIE